MKIEGLNPYTKHTLGFLNGAEITVSLTNLKVANDDYDPFADDGPLSFRERAFSPEKERLLEHYSQREPKKFTQYDVFVNAAEDSLVHPDKDGDWICWGDTTELMHGTDVRVLIPPETSGKNAVRVLRKIIDIIEAGEAFSGGAE